MALILSPSFYASLNRVQQLTWLQSHCTVPEALYRFKPISLVYGIIADKLMTLASVHKSPVGVTRPELIRVLNKYLSSDPEPTNAESALYRLEFGRQKKEFTVGSWEEVGELVVYELRSEKNYLKELELAEVALASPLIAATYTKVCTLLNACIEHSLTLLVPLRKRLPSSKTPLIEELEDEVDTWFKSTTFKVKFKHYRAYFPELENYSLSEAVNDRLDELKPDQKIALVHDMLQVLWDIYTFWVKKDGLGNSAVWPDFLDGEHPLSREMTTQTGVRKRGVGVLSWQENVMEPRGKDTDERSKQFAREQGRPSESGPSYTTVRFCGINNLVKTLRHVSDKLGVTLPPSIKELSKDERIHLVWGIFAFWSLRYRKSVTTAHCFFEIREAARQCDAEMAKGEGYPEVGPVKAALRSTHTPDLTSRLRKRALLMGMDQAIIADYSTLDSTTRTAFEAPGGESMVGVKVRQKLPNPFK